MTEKRNFKQYKWEAQRWMRCTSLVKKKQGDISLLNVPPTHLLKERLKNEVSELVIDNEN